MTPTLDLTAPSTPEYHELYNHAKTAYRKSTNDHFIESLSLNRSLYEHASRENHMLWQIFGIRFMGLCHHRLGGLDEAIKCFRHAITLAETLGEAALELVLLIKNHLANTLRQNCQLEEAYKLLRESLEQAPVRQYLHAHSRLLGSLGALLDQIGQRSASDDCYARFEVLSRLRDNPHRLANAVSLAARAAELRGDFAAAEEKYKEEARLAGELEDPPRVTSAILHSAWIAWRRKQPEKAIQGFKAALARANLGTAKRQADALELYAKFLYERGDLIGARQYFIRAKEGSRDLEKLANVDHGLALVCRSAGLYGESLEYLSRSVDYRAQLYAPLMTLKTLVTPRWEELKKFTEELVTEAFRVTRNRIERDKLARLVDRVHGEGTWKKTYAGEIRRIAGEPLWKHRERLRSECRSVWKKFLLSDCFSEFTPQSRKLLERAELSYSSAVDDLSRSVHLLALVVERELRHRLFEPAQQHFNDLTNTRGSKTHHAFSEIAKKRRRGPKFGNWTLGEMFKALEELIDPSVVASKGDMLQRLRIALAAYIPQLKRIAAANHGIESLDGKKLKLVDERNAVAHGDEKPLDRLQADAIKRHLAIDAGDGEPTILQALAQIHPDAAGAA